ncbi:MAG TPA: methanogenesis marker 3 protein [Methanomassiliicoccales archaeon]|jgi:putative methanogenesis marker protein 3
MRIIVNGRSVEANEGATVGDVIAGEPYTPGTMLACIRPMDKVRKGTDEFKFTTTKGAFVLKLNDSAEARTWKEAYIQTAGKSVRWATSKVIAVGSFPTDLTSVKGKAKYSRYEAFLSLGGFDANTTYVMFARSDHEGEYGLAGGVIGHVTKGRHVLSSLRESDKIIEVSPVVLELSSKDAFATTDLATKLEEGMSVESYVRVKLDHRSPISCEHFLVTVTPGTLKLTERTAAYTASSTNMDVSLIAEANDIRIPDMVTVRNTGAGTGRVYIYKLRRQVNPSHNTIGLVVSGAQLIHLVPDHSEVTMVTDPVRIMTIGMTQVQAKDFLDSLGLKQKRTGDGADDSMVVEQEPEFTMDAASSPEVETFGIRSDQIRDVTLADEEAPITSHYIRKMSGLDHKPIGTMKVHFTFEGMPMVTFEGNASVASGLVPENAFSVEKGVVRGEMGVTNMSRPNRGLIGIRLEPSNEFGPTGEEEHGTNMSGIVLSDLNALMAGLKDGDIVYIRQAPKSAPAPKAKKPRSPSTSEKKKPSAKKKVKKDAEDQ